MAKFPIYQSQAAYSAKPVGAPADLGGEAVGRAMSQIGRAAVTIGTQYFKRQHDSQVEFAEIEAKAIIAKAEQEMEDSVDEGDYPTIWAQAQAELAALSGDMSNSAAKNDWATRVRQIEVDGDAFVAGAQAKRIDDKQQYILSTKIAEMRESGDITKLDAYTQRQVNLNTMSAEERDTILAQARPVAEEASRKNMLDAAMVVAQDSPQQIISTSLADLRATYPSLHSRDVLSLKSVAQYAQDDEERAEKAFLVNLKSDALSKAEIGMPITEFSNMLSQTPSLDVDDRLELTRTFKNARHIFDTTGEDPWKQTQNSETLGRALLDILGPNDPTVVHGPEDIYDLWMADGTPQWSINDYFMVSNLWTDQHIQGAAAGWSRSFPTVAFGTDQIERAVFKGVEEPTPEMFAEYHRALSMWITESQKPEVFGSPEKMAAALDTILIPIQKEKSVGFLKWLTTLTPPMQAYKLGKKMILDTEGPAGNTVPLSMPFFGHEAMFMPDMSEGNPYSFAPKKEKEKEKKEGESK